MSFKVAYPLSCFLRSLQSRHLGFRMCSGDIYFSEEYSEDCLGRPNPIRADLKGASRSDYNVCFLFLSEYWLRKHEIINVIRLFCCKHRTGRNYNFCREWPVRKLWNIWLDRLDSWSKFNRIHETILSSPHPQTTFWIQEGYIYFLIHFWHVTSCY